MVAMVWGTHCCVGRASVVAKHRRECEAIDREIHLGSARTNAIRESRTGARGLLTVLLEGDTTETATLKAQGH